VAYLKTHYPAEFMAAVLSNQGGYFGPGAYVEEARRLGLRILPPDINDSERDYRGRERQIRMGLMAIGNLTEETIQIILDERKKHGKYISFNDFHRRVHIDSFQEELLVKSGTLDRFKCQQYSTRPALLWAIRTAHHSQSKFPSGQKDSSQLFDRMEYLAAPLFRDYDSVERFQIEKNIFGFSVSMHPLDFVPLKLRQGIVAAVELSDYKGKQVKLIGWSISSKRIKTRKTKAYMKFLSLEDATGTFEVTLFPKVYHKFADKTLAKGPYLVTGTVEEDHGVQSVVAQHIEQLQVEPLEEFGKDRLRRRDSEFQLRQRIKRSMGVQGKYYASF
jgi:DNA polymerase III alpha subunit